VALRGTPWHSVALRGTPWHSVALSGTQWHSVLPDRAIHGNQGARRPRGMVIHAIREHARHVRPATCLADSRRWPVATVRATRRAVPSAIKELGNVARRRERISSISERAQHGAGIRPASWDSLADGEQQRRRRRTNLLKLSSEGFEGLLTARHRRNTRDARSYAQPHGARWLSHLHATQSIAIKVRWHVAPATP
jgi:hypothetical protein